MKELQQKVKPNFYSSAKKNYSAFMWMMMMTSDKTEKLNYRMCQALDKNNLFIFQETLPFTIIIL